ncbi:MAG: hypothetical protein WKF67_06920 [Rubrobacteraceae bacterium]
MAHEAAHEAAHGVARLALARREAEKDWDLKANPIERLAFAKHLYFADLKLSVALDRFKEIAGDEVYSEDKYTHLFEADKVRINNEAKVRTALSYPYFAERKFDKWKAQQEPQLKKESHTIAWAKEAWLAEGRTPVMGRELDKLQKRIGRQWEANRNQNHALKETLERIEELENDYVQLVGFAKAKADRVTELEQTVELLELKNREVTKLRERLRSQEGGG